MKILKNIDQVINDNQSFVGQSTRVAKMSRGLSPNKTFDSSRENDVKSIQAKTQQSPEKNGGKINKE